VPLTIFTFVTDYAAAGTHLDALRAAVGTTTCDAKPLPKRLRSRLAGKLRQARKHVNRAAAGGPEARVTKSADKVDALVGAAGNLLAAAAGKLPPGCLGSLQAALGQVRQCLGR
jgi:hypothetical protein